MQSNIQYWFIAQIYSNYEAIQQHLKDLQIQPPIIFIEQKQKKNKLEVFGNYFGVGSEETIKYKATVSKARQKQTSTNPETTTTTRKKTKWIHFIVRWESLYEFNSGKNAKTHTNTHTYDHTHIQNAVGTSRQSLFYQSINQALIKKFIPIDYYAIYARKSDRRV